MDPAEEQGMEMEALEAILADDLTLHDGQRPEVGGVLWRNAFPPYPSHLVRLPLYQPPFSSPGSRPEQGWPSDVQIWSIMISPLEDGCTDRDKAPALLQFLFAFPPVYPNTAPFLRLRSEKGLSDVAIAHITKKVNTLVEENIGMPMIFTLVTDAKEWLVEHVEGTQHVNGGAEGDQGDDVQAQRKREEAELKRREAQRSAGTPVTPESFAAWKGAFDAEVALQKAHLVDIKTMSEKMKRLTGRKWFEEREARRAAGGGKGEDEEDEDEDAMGTYDSDEEAILRAATAGGGGGGGGGMSGVFDDSSDEADDDTDTDLSDLLASDGEGEVEEA